MSKALYIDLTDYFQPHPVQDYIMSRPAKWKLLECGRRFGKGRAAIFWIIYNYMELMSKPRPTSLVPIVHINVFVPSLASISVPWIELKKFIPTELVLTINEAEKSIRLLGGGLIEVKSGDIRAIQQGVGLDMVWITEADKIERSVWNDIVPMLRSQGRAGLAWIESKPYSEIGWFHELFELGTKKDVIESGRLESFHFTTFANPFVDWDDIEFDKLHMDDATWAKEYMAEVSGGQEAAFPGWKLRLRDPAEDPPLPDPDHFYQVGVDLGKQLSYSAIAVFDLNTRKVVYIERFQTSWAETRRRVAEVSRYWTVGGEPAPVYIDATGKGEPVVEALCADFPDIPIYDVTLGQASRYLALARLALAIEKGDITYPYYEPMNKELALMKRIRRSPYDQFRVPSGRRDDCVFALALAYNKEHIDTVIPVFTRSIMRPKSRRG